MQTNLLAEMSIDETAWLKSFDLKMTATLEQLGLDIEITPFWERGKKLNNIEFALLSLCNQRLAEAPMYSQDKAWNFIPLTSWSLMNFIEEIFYTALDKASKDTWKAFFLTTSEVTNDKLKELAEKKKHREKKIAKDIPEQTILDVIREEMRKLQPPQVANWFVTQTPQAIPLQQQLLPPSIEEYEEEEYEPAPTQLTIGGVRLTAR